MFLERLNNYGIESSQYYKYGGAYNPVKTATSDTAMPNCTDYALCRGYEATQCDKPFPIAKTTLGFGNAKDWWKQSPLPHTSEIVEGSIACFDGAYGHVAFVERKIDKTHALISQSQYDKNKSLRNYKYWEKRVVELIVGKATLSGVGALQGFLLLPVKKIDVARNSKMEQIELTQEMVNVRVKPNGDVVQSGCYAPMGIYNVLSKQIVDGFTWYELDKNCWVREGSWLNYYEKQDYEAILKENEEMKKAFLQVNEIVKKYI